MAKLANYKPGRVWFNNNMNGDIVIEVGVNDVLNVTVDGTPHALTLEAGTYKTSHNRFDSEFQNMLNRVFTSNSVPLKAGIGGIHDDNPRTVLIMEHQSEDEGHAITDLGGDVGDTLGTDQIFKVEPIHANSNLTSATAVRQMDITQLLGGVNIVFGGTSDTEGTTSVRQTTNEDLDSDVGVQGYADSDLTGGASINPPKHNPELKGDVSIKGGADADIDSELGIAGYGTTAIPGQIQAN